MQNSEGTSVMCMIGRLYATFVDMKCYATYCCNALPFSLCSWCYFDFFVSLLSTLVSHVCVKQANQCLPLCPAISFHSEVACL